MDILETLINSKKRVAFLAICLIALSLLFIKKSFIEDETAAFEFLAERPEGSWLRLRSTLQYVTIPLVYLWKFLVIGFVVWVGCFTMGYRVTFEQCWRVVMASEIVYFLPEVIKIIYFIAIETDPDFYRIQEFYPLSVIGFFRAETIGDAWRYPLKSINLFEPMYMFALAGSLAHVTGKSRRLTMRILLWTYLPVFLLWLIFWVIVYR
jgi:hypothetical protein